MRIHSIITLPQGILKLNINKLKRLNTSLFYFYPCFKQQRNWHIHYGPSVPRLSNLEFSFYTIEENQETNTRRVQLSYSAYDTTFVKTGLFLGFFPAK